MNNFYIERIQQLKRGNMTEYETVLNKVFQRFISWEELKSTDRKLQARVMLELGDAIELKKSPIDVRKLANAIQYSKSGAGGRAMMKFKCKFCGEEEMWGSTNTPGICSQCASSMAKRIAKFDILKDG